MHLIDAEEFEISAMVLIVVGEPVVEEDWACQSLRELEREIAGSIESATVVVS